MNDDYLKGFDAAKEKAKQAIQNVSLESYPPFDAFAYEPPTSSPRQARDVRNDCLDAVENLKP